MSLAKYCILGFGIAGQLLVLELLHRGVPSSDILLIDRTFLGGALATEYPTILSNTPWSKTRAVLKDYIPYSSLAIERGDSIYKETDCMPVRDIALYCSMTALSAAKDCDKLVSDVHTVIPLEGGGYRLEHTFGTVQTKTLFVATGATEKMLDIQIPRIPLSIAMDRQKLKYSVNSETDTVLVFGTAHSGTIVLENLHELGVKTTAVYTKQTPFSFARDGAYDGIKEGSEHIADRILEGKHTNLTLLSWQDPLTLHKHLKKATKVVYAIGFAPNLPKGLESTYDPKTAKVGTLPNLYGYGIAFPGKTLYKDTVYADVSVSSFQEQIRATLNNCLL